MEALLIDEWLGDHDGVEVLDDASLSIARERARAAADAQGLQRADGERLATITSELGRNQLRHGRKGEIVIRGIMRGGARGVEIVAGDRGEGLQDPAGALGGVARSSGSLGVGLASVRELAHETDFDVRLGEGTLVRARIFERELPVRRQFGIYGRPAKNERTSGDNAAFLHLDDGFVACVCDGLGHGEPAREASSRAIRTMRSVPDGDPRAILEACHRDLVGTRGAVMSVVRHRDLGSAVSISTVGNVVVELVCPRAARRFGGKSFVLGSRGQKSGVTDDAAVLASDETVIMFTDGVPSRTSVKDDLALLREHPIIIAQRSVERFAVDNDDVLVLVARS
jgi:anti-sigma regulatory factor (Ser/Thr protein kinase)